MEFRRMHLAADPDSDAAIVSGLIVDACKEGKGMTREDLSKLLTEMLMQSDRPSNCENALVDDIQETDDISKSNGGSELINAATGCRIYSDVLQTLIKIRNEKRRE